MPLPTQAGNWTRAYVKARNQDLKPLEVSQANGASFTVDGHEVKWQKWSFRVGFNPREGLVLYTVGYDGRPVLYRASIAEMIVPYADPKASSYHKNVFDMGEYGVGMLANSLELGCDCLGTIQYFDGHLCDSRGASGHHQKRDLPPRGEDFWNALEEAHRLAYDRFRGSSIAPDWPSRPSPPWVTTTMGFYWYLYQDAGAIQMEVKLTGIMNTTATQAR